MVVQSEQPPDEVRRLGAYSTNVFHGMNVGA